MGIMYYNGIPGILEKNMTMALKYLEEASAMGHFNSLNVLGNIYKDGVYPEI